MRSEKGRFVKKYNINENFFKIKSSSFYYLIGLLSSDGNVKNHKTFSISQSNECGKKLIEFVSKMIDSNYPIYHKDNIYSLTITNSDFVAVLKEYGIRPDKTLVFELPEKIEYCDLKYFIRGYIDGDGSIGIYDNGKGVKSLVVSIVGTEKFISQLNEKLTSKGNVRKIKTCKNLYEIRYNGKKALDLCYEIYEDVIYKSHKYNNFVRFINDDSVGKKYKKYYHLKNKVIGEIKLNYDLKTLSEKYHIPVKTLYTWKYRNI